MKKILSTVLSLLFVFTIAAAAQNTNSSTTTNSSAPAKAPRKPIFRANKDQIKQAQKILKDRGFYAGEQTGKLDDDTRAGLKKYQGAEGLKVTGTLNKVTLEKMGVALTDKQKTM
jgi:peptidoglycan hydrolase-like protein with peptidoglycan-binding domain